MNIFEEQKKYEKAIQIMNQDPYKDVLRGVFNAI